MSHDRADEMKRRLWSMNARKMRDVIGLKLADVGVFDVRFLDRDETMEIGDAYREKLRNIPPYAHADVPWISRSISGFFGEHYVYWHHLHSREAGLLVVKARAVFDVWGSLYAYFGKSIFMEATDGTRGIAYESCEYSDSMTWWENML